MEIVIHIPNQRLRVRLHPSDAVLMKLCLGLTIRNKAAVVARAQNLKSEMFVTMPQPFMKRKPFVKMLVHACAQNRKLMMTAPKEVVAT
eukprot:scaffold23077_cov196-Cylindrotheca_fusiformis.AAC.1